MKIIGIVPARMGSSRFPGKPLHLINGKTMLEHVYLRAELFKGWDVLGVATCDPEIEQFAKNKNFPVFMTGSHHTRALDRVAEAVETLDPKVDDNDIVVCVQGDEPMMRPDMISAVVTPLIEDLSIPGIILAMLILDESIWRNPDTVKVVHNSAGEVLYTSRSPIPYGGGKFSPELMARRIYGIFSFRWKYLKIFTAQPEGRLEKLESCDSNRFLDMPFRQRVALYPHYPSFSVDSPSDVALVEEHLHTDEYWHIYK